MYPRNAASPERIAVGAVVLIADGTVQTSGVSIAIHPQGGASAAGGNTPTYDNGIVLYTPTQAETNYTSFLVVAYKTGCIPASQTIVTSASATAGHAGVDWSQVANPTTAVNLSGTNIKTDQTVASVSGAVGSVTGAVGSVTGSVGSVTGAVGSVTGSVGSISGVTFPTNFGDLDITATAGTVTLKAATHAGAVIPTVSTLTGHTAQTGDSYARIGAPAGASVSADVAAVKTDTGNLVTRITATLFSGITSLAEWLGSMAGKQTPDTTAQTEMRASGAGSGTFDATTDSYEAIRDQGDSAWITGGGGAAPTALEVADAVWDEATSGHAVAGSAGKALTDTLADTSNLQGNQGNWVTATGFSTHAAADVWTAGTRTLTGSVSVSSMGAGTIDAASIAASALNGKGDWGDATAASQSTMTTHLTDIKGGTFSGATDSLEAIRDRGDAAWTTGSAGTGLSPLATGTAQGGTSSTVQLAAGEAVTTDLYKGSRVLLVSGTGAGQSRIVTAYNGTTKTCTVSPALVVTPDATTVYEIQAADSQIQMMDHTSLAGVTFPSNFGDMAITASTGLVTVGTNNDKAGYSISGTKTTLDALNDIAATAIVSGGAINTTSGAVDNVTLVATTTTNTDMVAAAPTAASVADAVWDETLTAHVTADSAAVQLKDVLADTGNLQGNQGNWVTATGFATAGDAMTLTAAYDAAKTAAAATDIVSNGAITTAGGAVSVVTGVTNLHASAATSANQSTITTHLTDIKGTGFVKDTDSLPQCLTATGFSTHTAANVRTEMDANSTQLASIVSDTAAILTDTGTSGVVIAPAQTVATVTTVTNAVTAGTVSDKTGYSLSSAGIDAILDEPITEPAGVFTWAGATLRNIVGWVGAMSRNKITQTGTTKSLRNDADAANVAQSTTTDDGTTATRGEWS